MGQIAKDYMSSFISDGNAQIFNLAYLPRRVHFLNKTKWATNTNELVKEALGFSSDPNGYAYVKYFDGDGDHGVANGTNNFNMVSGGISFITRDTPVFGAVVSASGADSVDKDADFMAVNINSHGFETGDVVWLTGTTGMLQIGGIPYTVTKVNDNQFTIPVDTSAYTFAADATAVTAKQLLYPDLYVPFLIHPTGIISASAPHADWALVTSSVDHRFKVGNRVKFQIPDEWGMVELDGLEGYVRDVGNVDNAQSYTEVTDGSAVNAFRVDIDVSGFTAFDYPTSLVAGNGIDFPTVRAIGDRNFGFIGPVPNDPLGIQGAFSANTGYQVLIGTGDGTRIMHANNDVCEVHFEFPEELGDSISV